MPPCQECWCQETVNPAAVCLIIPFPGSHPLKVQTSRFFNCFLTLLKLKYPNHALRPEPQICLFTCPSLTQWGSFFLHSWPDHAPLELLSGF